MAIGGCVPLPDAYAPKDRSKVLRRAFGHETHVWILRQAERSEAATRDPRKVVALKAHQYARLPEGSFVTHDQECWAEARYDAKRVKCPVEIWRPGPPIAGLIKSCLFQLAVGKWEDRRKGFQWPDGAYTIAWD
jgi:hypothetical protein